MTFREERGIKVRIEVGPKETESNECIVAKTQGIGLVASKSRQKVDQSLIKELRLLLNITQ